MKDNKEPNFFMKIFFRNRRPVQKEVELPLKMGEKHPVAVITAHGFYLKEDSIDYSRLQALAVKERDQENIRSKKESEQALGAEANS